MYQLFRNKWECPISFSHARGFDFSYLLPSFRLTETPPLESHWLTQQEEGTQSIRLWCLNTSSVTFFHISLVRVSHMATSNFNGCWRVTIFYIRNLRKMLIASTTAAMLDDILQLFVMGWIISFPKLIFWSLNSQYLKIQLYLEIRF